MPAPELGRDEALVRVAAVGICGSELEGYVGRMANRTPPLVMGHEFSGAVVEAREPSWVGKRVAVNPLIFCGRCVACRAGRPNLCAARTIVGIGRPGAFAELVAVPQSSLLELSHELADEGGALVEPLATVVHGFDLGLRHGAPESVLVVGAGSLGLLATQVALLSGAATVVATDLSDERLAHAAALGATATVGAGGDAGERLRELLPAGADLVVDCVGAAATKRLAIRHARDGGAVVLLGLQDDETPLSSHELIRREIALCGSYTYTPKDVRRSLGLLTRGRVAYDGWTTSMPLSEGPAAFDELASASRAHIKVLLRP
ncbi:MAG TPA: alcohol dehydrogenase catalytic domain-containing protein [Conexibacter sp.]|nr:alcohol dehydrogenase catalytic domain-containing protein [Conexibacter sp.]